MFPSSIARTGAVSVLLSCLRAAIGARNHPTPATSQRAQPTFGTQCPGPIEAPQAAEYTSPPTMEIPDKGSVNNGGGRLTSDELLHKSSFESIPEPGLIAPLSTPVPDKRVSDFAAVTIEHHPGTRLAEYDRKQTSVMHKLEIYDSCQEGLGGDTEARLSTASSIIDLNGPPDECPLQPRESFQNWIASTVNIVHPPYGEKSQETNH